MIRQQQILIVIAILVLFGMYFGLPTKPSEQLIIEKKRAENIEAVDVNSMIAMAKERISEADYAYLMSLQKIYRGTADDSSKIKVLKQLSGDWYRKGSKAVSGHFAAQVAEMENTDDSWSIAGTTYAAALKSEPMEPNVRDHVFSKAVEAFQNAYSLDATETEHQLNLAIMYAEYPLETNPMKGIQMLLELNRNAPENVSVLYHLARFGVQTGQYAKAAQRLEKALALEPDQQRLICLAADVYKNLKNSEKYAQFAALCNISNN